MEQTKSDKKKPTEKLLLLIGKGQKELNTSEGSIDRMEYRKARYFFPNNEHMIVETPFVGEAILKLCPGRFDEVHIFGTRDAMWDILYFHCLSLDGENLADPYVDPFLKLSGAIADRSLISTSPLLENVAEAFVQRTAVSRCYCHLIDLGTEPDHFWNIFRLMTSPDLGLDGCNISIDITHSLRFHPLFLVFTLQYFLSIRQPTGQSYPVDQTTLGAIFYAGLELQSDYRGKAPIFDLGLFLEMMEWIDAAQAFRNYGDTVPISHLLQGSNTPKALLAAMEDFSRIVQLNDVENIQNTSRKLLSAASNISGMEPATLALILPRILDFPKKLTATSSSWKAVLKLSRHHLDNSHIGLAVLSAWEAVIERIAQIYGVDARPIDNYKRLSQIARSVVIDTAYAHRLEISSKLCDLSRFRNAIAHAERTQPEDIARNFPNILEMLETHLGDAEWNKLPTLRAL